MNQVVMMNRYYKKNYISEDDFRMSIVESINFLKYKAIYKLGIVGFNKLGIDLDLMKLDLVSTKALIQMYHDLVHYVESEHIDYDFGVEEEPYEV